MSERPSPHSFLYYTRATAVIGYLSYFAGHLIFGLLVVPFFLLLAPFRKLRWRFIRGVFDWYVYFLSRQYLCWLGVYRIAEISGLKEARAAGPAIYIVNHRSRMDGPIMLATIRNSVPVIKASYGKNLLYAGFVRYLDFISVEPGVPSSLTAAMTQARRLIAEGKNIIIFPEGTRAPTGRMLPHKDIGLRLAQAANAPLIPVVLHSDLPFMARRPGSIFPPRTINFTIRFLAPRAIPPGQRLSITLADIEREMVHELRALDTGTVWENKRSA